MRNYFQNEIKSWHHLARTGICSNEVLLVPKHSVSQGVTEVQLLWIFWLSETVTGRDLGDYKSERRGRHAITPPRQCFGKDSLSTIGPVVVCSFQLCAGSFSLISDVESYLPEKKTWGDKVTWDHAFPKAAVFLWVRGHGSKALVWKCNGQDKKSCSENLINPGRKITVKFFWHRLDDLWPQCPCGVFLGSPDLSFSTLFKCKDILFHLEM